MSWVNMSHPLAEEHSLRVDVTYRHAAASDAVDIWFRASSAAPERHLARVLLFARRTMPHESWVQVGSEDVFDLLVDDALFDIARQLYAPVSLYEHLSFESDLTPEAIDQGAQSDQLTPLETERLLARLESW